MPTSIAPKKAPKQKRMTTTAAVLGSAAGTSAAATRSKDATGTATASTFFAPERPMRIPESGIVTSAPNPIASSTAPKAPSSSPNAVLTNGTSDAQSAIRKPARKNETRVAMCDGGISRSTSCQLKRSNDRRRMIDPGKLLTTEMPHILPRRQPDRMGAVRHLGLNENHYLARAETNSSRMQSSVKPSPESLCNNGFRELAARAPPTPEALHS